MIDKMSGRVSLLLVSGAAILIVLLGWFVLIAPERSKASDLGAQVDQTNVQLQAVTDLLQGPIGKESFASLKVAEIAIPDDSKVSQILRQLSAASLAAGVEIDSVAPQLAVAATGAEALPITMTVKGRYFAIQRFLRILRSEAALQGDKIRATGRLYTVDSIQFAGAAPATDGSGGGSTGNVQASLALNAYVYAPTVVAATPVTPTDTTSSSVAPTGP